MIIQAAPYFQRRFAANATILRYFQASYLVFFATTMFLTTVYLNSQRQQPLYTQRLWKALCGYVVVASLLMLSAFETFHVRAELYYPFTLIMVVMTGMANGLSQNAAFAFAAGFGRTEYAPAVMTGEALAGFIPSSIGKSIVPPAICKSLMTSRNHLSTRLSHRIFRCRRHREFPGVLLDNRILLLGSSSRSRILGGTGFPNSPQRSAATIQSL